jgi:hypothetical protein
MGAVEVTTLAMVGTGTGELAAVGAALPVADWLGP